jgi:fatty-acid desaturase
VSRLERNFSIAAVVAPFGRGDRRGCPRLARLPRAARPGGVRRLLRSSALGVTIGFHRLLTHRSFETFRWLRLTLALMGSLAVEGAVIHWVADHRKDHGFADEEGDPHSPHVAHFALGVALRAAWAGLVRIFLVHHCGWRVAASRRL